MPGSSLKEVVVTLFEKHYHFGVAALINSLVKNNFDGLLLVGYRGDLPNWVGKLGSLDDEQCYKLETVKVKFVLLDTAMHFGYYKPVILNHVFNSYPSVVRVFYFDPDIVINTKWQFFSNWANVGIALCLDASFPFVHENHPWRDDWRKLSAVDSQYFNSMEYYVNSGFIGLKKEDRLLLERWIDITYKYQQENGDLTQFEKDGSRSFKGDQDLLNAAMTVSSDLTFSIIGQEGMGFSQPAYLMTHAIDAVKPWKKIFIKNLLLKGKKPNLLEKNYFKYCNSPVIVYSKNEMRLKTLDLKISAAIGRFIGS